jgi:hypothetical protein
MKYLIVLMLLIPGISEARVKGTYFPYSIYSDYSTCYERYDGDGYVDTVCDDPGQEWTLSEVDVMDNGYMFYDGEKE